MGKRKVTLADIGQECNLSVATVSMILSGRTGSFPPETVESVRQEAQRLGYEARAKHNLPTAYTERTVLIVCPNVVNAYYSTLIQAIQQAAGAKGFGSVVCTTFRDAAAEENIVRSFSGTGIAGMIFAMPPQSVSLLEKINKHCPVVLIGDRAGSVSLDTVELNNKEAGRLIGEYLIQQGHKNIAYISTTLNAANAIRIRRLEGLREAYASGCPEGSVQVYSQNISPVEERAELNLEHRVGLELGSRCLAEGKISAMVAVNDMVAYGVLDAVKAAGLSVPADCSVCGFDNIFPSQFASVALTSVDHNLEEKGHSAFSMLYARIRRGIAGNRNITRVEIMPQLVIRASSGPCHR